MIFTVVHLIMDLCHNRNWVFTPSLQVQTMRENVLDKTNVLSAYSLLWNTLYLFCTAFLGSPAHSHPYTSH